MEKTLRRLRRSDLLQCDSELVRRHDGANSEITNPRRGRTLLTDEKFAKETGEPCSSRISKSLLDNLTVNRLYRVCDMMVYYSSIDLCLKNGNDDLTRNA